MQIFPGLSFAKVNNNAAVPGLIVSIKREMPVVSNHDERRKKEKKLHNLICYVHKSILKTFHLSSQKSLCNRNLKFSN